MKKKYLPWILLCLIACAACLLLALPEKEPESVTPLAPVPQKVEPEKYVSPIDFAELQKTGSEIYGWLTIPGTEISYPVLQSAIDDTMYLNHNEKQEWDENGSLFTESEFNGRDFTDPVTIIYGHHMRSGAMFGNLQTLFTDRFDELRELVIYLPEQELHYQVFAAVAYDNRHILYHYDKFSQLSSMTDFVQTLSASHGIGNHFDDSCTVEETDHLLVLSTCLQGNNTNRFLVVGKLLDNKT